MDLEAFEYILIVCIYLVLPQTYILYNHFINPQFTFMRSDGVPYLDSI